MTEIVASDQSPADSAGKQDELNLSTLWPPDMVRQTWRHWLNGSETPFQPMAAPAPRRKVASTVPEVDPPTTLDRMVNVARGRWTRGVSPEALWLAYADWWTHLAVSPGQQQRLAQKAARKAVRYFIKLGQHAVDPNCDPCIEPLAQDHRFDSDGWKRPPFNMIYQAFLLHQQWWHNATTGVVGVSKHHEQVVTFMTRQMLDMVSPVNFILTNPEVLNATMREGGRNLVRGMINFWADWERMAGGKPPVGAEAFEPGRNVAVTPGSVVFRNRLIELIQYAPTTNEVKAEPILITPAWIMKYYILDLSPENSMVKYLVDSGHTVFVISWRNPTAEDRDLGMEDYLRLGVLAALEAIQAITPGRKVNAVGYCLGGTLLTIAAAWLAMRGDDSLNSISLLAAQTDFTEPGELSLFIDESQLSFLEDIMWDQGYLDTNQMAGAFQLLRSYDLVWSRMVNEYLLGRRAPMTDLMAWNADGTRMPYRMHSEYLRRLFLRNDLFEGRFDVGGRTIALSDIRAPLFVVSTERDHVAPWKSVFKLNLACDADLTFVLASGGHNAGIVSEPGKPNRHYRMDERPHDAAYVDPDTWYVRTPQQDGSWWDAWLDWINQRSGDNAQPPSMGAPDKGYAVLEAAPGRHVFGR